MDTRLMWIIALLALILFGPSLLNRLAATVFRNTVFKSQNARGRHLTERLVHIDIPGVLPAEFIRAIVGEAGFGTERTWLSSVYISGWDDEQVVFEYTRKTNLEGAPFTAVLVAKANGSGDGCTAEYGLAEVHEIGGEIVGVSEMEETERTIRQFTKWRFPEATVTT